MRINTHTTQIKRAHKIESNQPTPKTLQHLTLLLPTAVFAHSTR